MSEEHIAYLSLRESIDIFLWVDTLGDGISVDMRGKWRLDDDTVYFLILREITDFSFEVRLVDSSRESIESEIHPDFTCALLLHTDIGETRRIRSHEYDREQGSIAHRRKSNLVFYIFEDGGCDETSVEEHALAERNKQGADRL
jgi:hypothetical protein